MTTSEKIKIELMRKSMTQEELASKLQLTPTTISRRMSSNTWKIGEVAYMTHILKFDLK